VKGDLQSALMAFGQLRRRGFRADSILYHSILDGCANRQMTPLAEQVLQDMINDGHSPTNITLSILVKLYGRTSLARALEIFEQIPARHNFKPNAQVYTCLMSVALTHRCVDEAMNIKRRMIEAGCPPDSKMYQTLLNGCLRQQHLDEAVEIAEEALAARALAPAALDDFLFMLERRGRHETAARLRAERTSMQHRRNN